MLRFYQIVSLLCTSGIDLSERTNETKIYSISISSQCTYEFLMKKITFCNENIADFKLTRSIFQLFLPFKTYDSGCTYVYYKRAYLLRHTIEYQQVYRIKVTSTKIKNNTSYLLNLKKLYKMNKNLFNVPYRVQMFQLLMLYQLTSQRRSTITLTDRDSSPQCNISRE